MDDHAYADEPAQPVESATANLLPIVVGSHPRAERWDRPLAYRLRQRIIGLEGEGRPVLEPLPCTDLWYLNDPALLDRPAVCLGAPEVNAATAYFGSRTPTALVIEDTLRVHLDPEYIEVRACLWGVDDEATAMAVDLFCDRYLGRFLEEAAR